MTHVRAHLHIPEELVSAVDALVGPRQRSAFVARAISEQLRREKLLQLLEATQQLPPPETISEWSTPERASKWVHDGRVAADKIRAARWSKRGDTHK